MTIPSYTNSVAGSQNGWSVVGDSVESELLPKAASLTDVQLPNCFNSSYRTCFPSYHQPLLAISTIAKG